MSPDLRDFLCPTIITEPMTDGRATPYPIVHGSADAVGWDICAGEGAIIPPFSGVNIGTGWRFLIPKDYEMQVRSRSGMSSKGIIVANTPATIDPDYRGELRLLLRNLTDEGYLVSPGDRVAQLVIAPRLRPIFKAGHVPNDTARGAGGIGSTGLN